MEEDGRKRNFFSRFSISCTNNATAETAKKNRTLFILNDLKLINE